MVINTICVIQGRLGSKRFPNKILKPIAKNLSVIQFLIRRINKSKKIDKIIFATSKNQNNDLIKKILVKENCEIFFGDENNVLKRFNDSVKKYKFRDIVRITADCPFVDPKVIDKMLYIHKKDNYDFTHNTSTFPDGLDVEIFKYKFLKKATVKAKSNYEKEHVTPFIKNIKNLKLFNYNLDKDYSNLRVTLDYPEDYNLIKKIYGKLFKIKKYGYQDIIKIMKKNKNLTKINQKYNKLDGSKILSGQKLWKRANEIIPGGTMLFSKNPDLFLPVKWPAYFEKSKGCKIWDVDKIAYHDLSLMGVGTNILGYSNPVVDREVIKTIKNGNMTTLNSFQEIELAERLIDLHPWADMARFTRSGGEANAVAIRIARATSGKDNVAICGYHGWHDWYLASNLKDKNNLDKHLMKNVPYSGVPSRLKNSCHPFEYNNFNQLKYLVERKNIGVIKMEVHRNEEPRNHFLSKVRKLASDKNIVLIFDECTSGFRKTFGGLHKYYKITPDIAIFGKALGNGYAINAVIGKKSIMDKTNNTFISSTFWTERIGPTAALATLREMEKIKSWDVISSIGKKIKKQWSSISKINSVSIDIQGIDALPNFIFKSKNHLKYKTFVTQEMLKRKILASNSIYCSISHTDKVMNKYFDLLNKFFYKISKIEKNELNLEDCLKSPVCLSGLRNIK